MADTHLAEMSPEDPPGRTAPLYVIGLGLPGSAGDCSCERAAPHPVLASADVLIGGRSQLAAFADHPAEKIPVGSDTAAVYERIEANRRAGRLQVALCGGDPLFFGLGARLAERFAPGDLRILPGLSSLQAAAAFLGAAWEKAEAVSLHGRDDWLPFAHALIRAACGGGPIFLLTDAAASPAAVAAFMHERGHSRHTLHVMGNLHRLPDAGFPASPFPTGTAERPGRVRAEYYARLTVDEALRLPETAPQEARPLQRVIWIEPANPADPERAPAWPFGLPDAAPAGEDPPLTKAPVRAAALAALGIAAGDTVWDLGAGSGAVSLEAARIAHRGRVVAVEAKSERVLLLHRRRQYVGAANLEIVHGRLPEILDACLSLWPRPQRVFLGGGLSGNADPQSGGRAEGTFRAAWNALLPGGRMLIPCVLFSTLESARRLLAGAGAAAEVACIQASRSVPLAGDCRLQAFNPVFLVSALKGSAD
jgi:precorrin-6Y C5,15-methyltransferase (decarboxylating)